MAQTIVIEFDTEADDYDGCMNMFPLREGDEYQEVEPWLGELRLAGDGLTTRQQDYLDSLQAVKSYKNYV